MQINIFEILRILLNQFPTSQGTEHIIDTMIDSTMKSMGLLSIISAILTICVVVVPIFFIAFLIYKHITSDKKVRLELARHGIVPPMQKLRPAPDRYRTLRNAFMCTGIALGLFIGIIIISLKDFDETIKYLIICSSTILFLGVSYFGYFIVAKDKKPDDDTMK